MKVSQDRGGGGGLLKGDLTHQSPNPSLKSRVPTQIVFSNSLCFPCLTVNLGIFAANIEIALPFREFTTWANQIPCVFPDRDFFWQFSLFSLCSGYSVKGLLVLIRDSWYQWKQHQNRISGSEVVTKTCIYYLVDGGGHFTGHFAAYIRPRIHHLGEWGSQCSKLRVHTFPRPGARFPGTKYQVTCESHCYILAHKIKP